MKNCLFSHKSQKEIKLKFPNVSLPHPLLNTYISISLDIEFNKPQIIKIDLKEMGDITKTISEQVTLMADHWLENDLLKDDDVSIVDLLGATVTIADDTTPYYIQLGFKTKVEPLGLS